MALFNFGKKKEEEKKASACACSCGCCSENNTEQSEKSCCPEAENGICCIKVLGAGCASCHRQYENVKEAVNNMGLDAEVEYITDMAVVMEYGVMSMPAIVLNEKVVSMGKVMKTEDVEKLLREFKQDAAK